MRGGREDLKKLLEVLIGVKGSWFWKEKLMFGLNNLAEFGDF